MIALRRLVAPLCLILSAAGCAAPAGNAPGVSPAAAPTSSAARGPAVAVAVGNAGFEDPGEGPPRRNCPPQWWCTMHADPTSFKFASVPDGPSGRHLRVERVKNEPWALVTQVIPSKGLEGRTLRVSADVATRSMKDGDGAGPVVRLYVPGGRVSAAEKTLRAPGAGWGRVVVEIKVPKGIELVEIGLVMYGDGVADFDNIAVEHVSG